MPTSPRRLLEPLLLRDVLRALDVGDLVDLLLRRLAPASWSRPGTGRRGARAGDCTFSVVVELALITGMNTPEQQRRDHDRDDRGEARGGAAAQGAERLGDEEEDPAHRQLLGGGLTAASPFVCPSRDAHLGAHAHAELARRLVVVAGRRLVAHQPALVEREHPAAHLVDHLAVVGDDEHGGAGAVDPVEQLHDPDRGLGIEVPGRLVREQQRRMVDERPRDRDALLLAARELVRIVVDLALEADEPQDLGDLAPDLAAAGAGHLERVGDVVVDGAVGKQLEVLEHGADPAAQVGDAPLREAIDVAAGDQHLAARAGSTSRIRILIRVDLPQPVGPTTKANSPALDPERDALQRRRGRRGRRRWRRAARRSAAGRERPPARHRGTARCGPRRRACAVYVSEVATCERLSSMRRTILAA